MTEQTIIPLKLYLCHEIDQAYCVWDQKSMKTRGFGRREIWIPKRGITKVRRINDNVWLFMVPEKTALEKDLINDRTT